MSVIRRWRCPKCDASYGAPRMCSGTHADVNSHTVVYTVETEYVPAKQLRGAVSLADAADALVKAILANGHVTRADVQPLVDALDAFRAGGQ